MQNIMRENAKLKKNNIKLAHKIEFNKHNNTYCR